MTADILTTATLMTDAPAGATLDLRHLLRLSDEVGLFEHASGAIARRAHGYCVDDVARGLVVLCREPFPSDILVELSGRYLTFLAHAQGPDGGFHNRLGYDRRWHDEPGTGDWWGRALWGLGTAAACSPAPWIRDAALEFFVSGARLRSVHLRSMAFAALGAAQVVAAHPGHRPARALLADSAKMIDAAGIDAAGNDTAGNDSAWPWPQDRLHYANAILPEVLLSAGHALPDAAAMARGLQLLGWLLEAESNDGHLSPAPAGGWSPGDKRPGFDQQPIEIAAIADACATAFAITADPRWAGGIRQAAAWFRGANDARTLMYDPGTGGGYDGLTATGPNSNQGAESTLALLSTMQHDRRLRTENP